MAAMTGSVMKLWAHVANLDLLRQYAAMDADFKRLAQSPVRSQCDQGD